MLCSGVDPELRVLPNETGFSGTHTAHMPGRSEQLGGVGEVPTGGESGEARKAHSTGSRAQARGRCMWVKSLAFPNFILALPLPRH